MLNMNSHEKFSIYLNESNPYTHMPYQHKISRQLVFFILVGAIQFGLDTSLLWLMVLADTPIGLANFSSRAMAACAGFYMNKKLTFRSIVQLHPSKWLYLRYGILWCTMTAASTILIKTAPALLGFQYSHQSNYIVVTKITIELFLFIVSFTISRKLVFRHA